MSFFETASNAIESIFTSEDAYMLVGMPFTGSSEGIEDYIGIPSDNADGSNREIEIDI